MEHQLPPDPIAITPATMDQCLKLRAKLDPFSPVDFVKHFIKEKKLGQSQFESLLKTPRGPRRARI